MTVGQKKAAQNIDYRQTEPWPFRPISGPRAHEEVVDQITFAIRAGAFKPGERLPNIEDLASLMAVSKPTIGEAVKVLSRAGVLAAHRGIGGGLTVESDNIPHAIMGLASSWRAATLTELAEARRPIEVQIALLAAERGGPAEFEVLEHSIQRLIEHADGDPGSRIYYDHLFHYSLGRAARSDLLAYYQHQILEQLYLQMRSYFDIHEDVQAVIDLHRSTLEAVQHGVPEEIVAAIDDHLKPLEEYVAAQQKVTRLTA